MPVITSDELPVKQEVREYRVMCQRCRFNVSVGEAFAHSLMDEENRQRSERWANRHAEENPDHRLVIQQFTKFELVYTVVRKDGER